MKIVVIAGILALSAAFGTLEASAQGRGGGQGGGYGAGLGPPGSQAGEMRGLDRADRVAGNHGDEGRAAARARGANKPGFCPPGQRKKAGLGSRFRC